jgi:hypothetical protein
MYPSLFFWWNPVIHFPLSGAVSQDIEHTVNHMRHRMGVLSDAFAELAAHSTAPGQRRDRASADRLVALTAQLATPDGEAEGQRTERTRALLKVLRNLDPEEFARLLQNVSEEGND